MTSLFQKLFWLLALIGLFWLLGFLWFTREVAGLTPPSDPRAVAIVVLTGGGGRVEEGLTLLQVGNAKRLLISGVHHDVSRDELLSRAGVPIDAKLIDCCIALGYTADSTEGNAAEAAAWAAANHVPSLIVVTASYHLPRALLEFHRLLPKAELVPYPLPRAAVDAGQWWQSLSATRLLLVEYAKYTAALARAAFGLVRG